MASWFNIIHSGRRVPGKMAREKGTAQLSSWKGKFSVPVQLLFRFALRNGDIL
jgi:hypothetical protein